MKFGKLTLSPGQVRSFAIVTGMVLLYLVVLDPLLRPPLREMTIEDYLEAEGLFHQKTLNDTQQTLNATAPVNTTASASRILIVSAMFPLAKAKHSKADYEDWLAQFLGVITTDIYMYTTPDLGETLRRVRGDLPITIDTNYSSPFEVPPLRDLEEIYTRMNDMDAEKWHHSPGLYAIWNAKPYLLNEAVNVLKAQGKVYDYAFWNDGGSFRRAHHYSDWPHPARIDQVWEEGTQLTGQRAEDLLFFPVFQPPVEKFKDWQEDMGPIANPVQLSEGSFFGGAPSTIAWFAKVFYAYHDHYLAHGLFVGIDQDIFNALFLLFPARMFTVWMNDPRAPAHAGIVPSPSLVPSLERGFLGECGAEWFYYQFWLADAPARDAMRATWMREERWRKSGWWQARRLCRVTRAMSMLDFLRTSFGESWNPPPRAVAIPGIQSDHDM